MIAHELCAGGRFDYQQSEWAWEAMHEPQKQTSPMVENKVGPHIEPFKR